MNPPDALRQPVRAVMGSVVTSARAIRSRPWRPGLDPRAEQTAPLPSTRETTPASTPDDQTVVIVGGGIAGVAATVVLAERGVKVTLLEREPSLGGRVRSWPLENSPGGSPARMSRGFHAFFRQYYNLRSLLRRVDPALSGLVPVADYPLLHGDGSRDSFTSIPRRPPLNVLGFVATSPSFRWRDLPSVDVNQAMGLLDVDFPATFAAHDGVSAHEILRRIGFPRAMRDLALEVFTRSFFCDPRQFSGGEMVGMFHSYFVGSAEGLLFDVAADDFDTVIWKPLHQYLTRRGVTVLTETAAVTVKDRGEAILVTDSAGTEHRGDALVLATDRTGLQHLVDQTPWLGDVGWRESILRQELAPRFVVHRLWFDRPVRPGTDAFVGTAGHGFLDNVSAVHTFERWASDWAQAAGGSVMELHAYAVPDDVAEADVLADLSNHLFRLHPELADAAVLHEEILTRQDCPLIGTDPWAARPGVTTPDPRVMLAGDGIRCELPVALMERAATTGFQAANHVLQNWGLPQEPVWSVPTASRFPRSVGAARWLLQRLDRRNPPTPPPNPQELRHDHATGTALHPAGNPG